MGPCGVRPGEQVKRQIMPAGAGPLLRRYPRFSSRNVDEVQALMHGDGLGFDVHPRDARSLDLVSRGVLLPGSWIGYIRYGAPGVVWTPPGCQQPDSFWALFPIHGHSEIMTKTGGYECSPTRSAVYPSGLRHRSGENAERITFNVSAATLIRHLEALLGETPRQSLQFTPELDLETAYGRRLRRHVGNVISDFDEAGPEGVRPTMASMYEQLILTEMLLSQPNTFTAALHRLENHVATGDVKRAIDFIEAHLQLPITLADIAGAAGVPGRTLLEHFKHHCGRSPMRYLKTARLARVRDALKRADRDSGTAVTQIATEWGFSHLGRFAVEYRAQFGESPSETLRRRS